MLKETFLSRNQQKKKKKYEHHGNQHIRIYLQKARRKQQLLEQPPLQTHQNHRKEVQK